MARWTRGPDGYRQLASGLAAQVQAIGTNVIGRSERDEEEEDEKQRRKKIDGHDCPGVLSLASHRKLLYSTSGRKNLYQMTFISAK